MAELGLIAHKQTHWQTFFGKSMTYLFLGVLIVLGPPNNAPPEILYTFIAGLIIVFIAFLYFVRFTPAAAGRTGTDN